MCLIEFTEFVTIKDDVIQVEATLPSLRDIVA